MLRIQPVVWLRTNVEVIVSYSSRRCGPTQALWNDKDCNTHHAVQQWRSETEMQMVGRAYIVIVATAIDRMTVTSQDTSSTILDGAFHPFLKTCPTG